MGEFLWPENGVLEMGEGYEDLADLVDRLFETESESVLNGLDPAYQTVIEYQEDEEAFIVFQIVVPETESEWPESLPLNDCRTIAVIIAEDSEGGGVSAIASSVEAAKKYIDRIIADN